MRSRRIGAGHGLMFSRAVVDRRWRTIATTWVRLSIYLTASPGGLALFRCSLVAPRSA
jgi:hypothetical protein